MRVKQSAWTAPFGVVDEVEVPHRAMGLRALTGHSSGLACLKIE